jgi:gliding motility-associated-like protein
MVPFKNLRFFAAVLSLCAFSGMRAAHIIGGELYYDHLGNNLYQITLKLYRDCNGTGAAFDAFGRISVYTGNGVFVSQHNIPYPGSTFIPVELDSPCLTLPPNLCVETTSYITTLNLPPSLDGYHISYQRCCRQPAVVNILDPGVVGLTCTIQVPVAGSHENSSARFNDLPPVALCLNEPLAFDHSATDPDGDQLVYSLITPYTGGSIGNPYPATAAPPPYTPIPWSPGYSEQYQINSVPELAIDASTGLLTVQPSIVGNFVIGVSVKEYRNGNLLSETIRDFLFSVVPCDATVEAAIVPQTMFCTGELTFSPVNNSIGGQYYAWDFGDPSVTNDVSDLHSPTWTYANPGTYTITLIVNPGEVCADTAQVVYALYANPEPFFTPPPPSCGPLETLLTAEGVFGQQANFAWYLGWASPSFSTQQQVAVTFPPQGVQEVTLNITENGCTGSYTGYVQANPEPSAFFSADPLSPQLQGTDIVFLNGSTGNGATITDLVWTMNGTGMGGGNLLDWQNAAPGTYIITLTVTTSDGCSDTFTMPYVIQPEVIIPGEIVIPNVFTPNNDGNNDAFVIENVEFYENVLVVYNRWGNPIYETRNYRNQWRAPDVSDGTYYYELRISDGRTFTGHLTVLR